MSGSGSYCRGPKAQSEVEQLRVAVSHECPDGNLEQAVREAKVQEEPNT